MSSKAEKAPVKGEMQQQGAKRRLFGGDGADDHVEEPPTGTSPAAAAPAIVSVLETPQKKSRIGRRGQQTLEFSPTGKAPVVTPAKEDKVKTPVKQKKQDGYVPAYIHKNLSYQREGTATLSETTRKVFDLVKEHFVIPDDFEQSREYGPLSGICFEVRVIREYNLGTLKVSKEGEEGLDFIICSNCAAEGHKRVECPHLI
jgi:hypothetical protein